jgi:hypothetical protein
MIAALACKVFDIRWNEDGAKDESESFATVVRLESGLSKGIIYRMMKVRWGGATIRIKYRRD